MNRKVKMGIVSSLLLSLIVSCSSGGLGAKRKLQVYEDDQLSFNYPETWEVKRIPQGDQIFYNINAYNEKGEFSFTLIFNIEGPSPDDARLDLRGLEDKFGIKEGATIRSEIVTIASGEKAFYCEAKQDAEKHYGFGYLIGLLIPVGNEQANYSIIGGVQLKEDMYAVIKDGKLADLVKSIKLKLK